MNLDKVFETKKAVIFFKKNTNEINEEKKPLLTGPIHQQFSISRPSHPITQHPFTIYIHVEKF